MLIYWAGGGPHEATNATDGPTTAATTGAAGAEPGGGPAQVHERHERPAVGIPAARDGRHLDELLFHLPTASGQREGSRHREHPRAPRAQHPQGQPRQSRPGGLITTAPALDFALPAAMMDDVYVFNLGLYAFFSCASGGMDGRKCMCVCVLAKCGRRDPAARRRRRLGGPGNPPYDES